MQGWSDTWPARVLFTLSILWLAPALACGSFAQRPTPTPTAPVQVVIDSTGDNPATTPVLLTPAPPVAPATETATLVPTPTTTFTPTPQPGTVLAVGQPARVVAPAGLNLRDRPSAAGALLLQLGTGVKVTVLEGPQSADSFTWWKVDDGQGNIGWVAERDADTEWLSPKLGQAQPANRPPRVGDRVQVTTDQLTIRVVPGTDGAIVARARDGQQFTVLAGPQSADGYTWYQIRSDDGAVEGWAADGNGGNRWLSPLE